MKGKTGMRKPQYILPAAALLLALSAILAGIALGQEAPRSAVVMIEDRDYNLGKVVDIKLNTLDFQGNTMKIRTQKKLYTYNGNLQSNLKFRPIETGIHVVTLEDRTTQEVIGRAEFNVIGISAGSSGDAPSISTDKEEYTSGESINIDLTGDLNTYRLFLIQNGNPMLYAGELGNRITIPPMAAGNYSLQLRDMDNSLLSETHFIIRERKQLRLPEPAGPEPEKLAGIKGLKADITRNGNKVDLEELSSIKGRVDANLRIPGIAKKLEFKGLQTGTADNLKIKKVDSKRVSLPTGRALDVMAIDPSAMDFTSASLTRTAKGTELWKCAQWDYETETCNGAWVKMMNLIPGKEYKVPISPSDPAFAEAGVATINSKKPVYKPTETAEFYIVVLDTKGELVGGADITLEVTDPNGVIRTLSTQNNQIVETLHGVYEAQYTSTSKEGTYLLDVHATAPGVNQTMQSHFLVQSSYDFDIIRDTPVTIDPRRPFNSTIFIEPFISAGSYNFTEVLPGNFTILDAEGANIFSQGGFIYLTWTSLAGVSSVRYEADAPDIIPNVEVLGPSYIEHTDGLFEEARPWYMAIDPELTDTGLSSNNTNVTQGDTITVTGNLFCSGGGQPINYQVWLEDDGSAIDTTDIGVDFSCAGASSVNVLLCEADSCTVNADCSVTVSSCGNNDDVDIEWILTAEGDNEPLASANILEMDSSISDSLDNTVNINITPGGAGAPPSVTINQPRDTLFTYTYNGITNPSSTNAAYSGAVSGLPPASSISPVTLGTEASTAEYLALNESDDSRYVTTISNSSSVHAYQSFKFKLSESPSDITRLEFTHEGYATEKSNQAGDDFHIYIYNATADSYQLLQTVSASTSDVTTQVILTDGFSDYVSSGEVYFLIEGDFVTGGGANARADILTDNIALEISQSPVISGTASPINATAIDSDGVDMCEYTIYNSTTTLVDLTGMEDLGGNSWYNVTDTTAIPDGAYTLLVTCNDTTGLVTNKTTRVVVSNAEPTVNLVSPASGTDFGVNSIDFLWNATDPRGGSLNCNLYLDGSLNTSATVDSGDTANETVNGISDGLHFWNVTCTASSGIDAFSETRNFTIDTLSPVVKQEAPAPGASSNVVNQTLFYNVSDANDILNCSFIVNGAVNQTNSSVIKDTSQNFSLAGMAEGLYTWKVNCTDDSFRTGNSTLRNITIDITAPSVFLNTSGGINFSNGTAQLNFTAFDNLDDILICNITVNSAVEDPDIPAANNTFIPRNVSLSDGFKLWNVTCIDNAGNTATSETRNFSLVGPPLVELNAPPDGTFDQGTFVNFSYSAEDGNGIQNCTFLWDGIENQTDTNVSNGASLSNAFNLSSIQEGYHNWTVSCIDGNNETRAAAPHDIIIDSTSPDISLFAPLNNSNTTTGNMTFNFTAIDFFDTSLTCSLEVSSHTESASNINFEALNNTLQSRNETGLSDGVKYWNVTCIDEAGNSGTSGNWNFTAFGSPNVNLQNPANQETVFGTFINFTYIPSDVNGVASCEFIFDVSINDTDSSITSGQLTAFNLSSVAEGLHTWNVNCTDTTGQEGEGTLRNLTVDRTSPTVLAHNPNGSTFNGNNIDFNFTATDGLDTAMNCNVTVDTGESNTGIANNNTPTVITVTGVSEGFHYWNVTCSDNAPNNATSDTLNFTIDASPVVNLTSPADGFGSTTGNLTFLYTVNDTALNNCSLIFNESINQTDSAAQIPHVGDGLENNFTLDNVSQGVYTWTVNCTDDNGFTGTDTSRELHVDFFAPNVSLNTPLPNATIFVADVVFNWTVIDNIDPTLNCNLTINGTVNQTNVASPNNTATTTTVTFSEVGTYLWNVTCVDNTGFVDFSETRNFTLNSTPNVDLQQPPEGTTDPDGSINFTYIPSSFVGFDSIGFCEFFLDGASTDVDFFIENGVVNGFFQPSVSEGSHTWQVNCTDDNSNLAFDGPRNITVDLTNPAVFLNLPNGTTINTSTVNLNWTATDNLDDVLLCDITVNGTLQTPQDVQSQNNTPTNQSYSGFTDGIHYWNVTCADNGLRENTSSTFNFTVAEPPFIALGNPPNATRTNLVNQILYYTPTDNSGAIENCSLVLNSQVNQTNSTINESQENNFSLTDLNDGTYEWTVNCTDPSGNEGTNETGKTFFIDLTGPTITLNDPEPAELFNQNNITFNWTATDFDNTFINCTVFVSDDPVQKSNSTNETSGADHVTLIPNLADGLHYWNVTCMDDLGNPTTSELRNFTINQPDIATSNGNLTFSNDNPVVGENVTVFINISNIGGNPVTNALIEFWDGERGTGAFIGNRTVTIPVNGSDILNRSFTITAGFHAINVYADPDNAIEELSELNNNATRNLSTLTVNITSPLNGTFTSDTTPEINFTMRDYTNTSQLNYTIYVDGSANGQTGQNLDGNATVLSMAPALSEGSHDIIVQATDPLGRGRNSTPVTIIVDLTAPVPSFETANGSFFNNTTPRIFYNITDNLDPVLNWTLYLDGSPHRNGTVSSNVSSNVSTGPIAEGEHILTLETVDDVGNVNSTNITIFIDLTAPVVSLNAPPQNENFTVTSVQLNYSVSDNLDTTLACDVRLDGNVVNSTTAGNNTLQSYTATELAEGTHAWNVTCSDSAFNANVSENRNFNVFIAPNVTLLAPPNNTITNNATIQFRYNVTDDTGINSCSLLLDGAVNQTNSTVVNNAENSFNVTFGSSRVLTWAVQCADNTTQQVTGYSQNWTLTVDLEAPEPLFETANETWFNTATPTINFNITDNLDSNLSYAIYVNGIALRTGFALNATSTSDVLDVLADGTYILTLEGIDDTGNSANSTNLTIYIDTIAPNVTLLFPENDINLSQTFTTLNFTVIDSLDSVLVCTLNLDDSPIRQNFNVSNQSVSNTSVSGLASGRHYWNATCTDEAGNTGVSQTYNFLVESPDLTINNILFNDTSPAEEENITISANVTNIGSLNASNITVQLYLNDPASGGTQINGNKTISLLGINQSTLVSVNYTTIIGANNIFAVVDPPLATNGSIEEEDESNNKFNETITVGHYNIVAGDTVDVLHVDDPGLIPLFTWNVSDATGSNVFVADTDSSIEFTQLQAIGRNTTNQSRFDDFAEVDVQLGSSSYNDSVNRTWTSGGQPISLKTFTVFNSDIENVAVVNSTNTSDFQTGLLWDTSDGGNEYNGTQDLVIITEVNEDKTGQFGTYDYEIKIPATMRDYSGGTSSVTFYTEIKG